MASFFYQYLPYLVLVSHVLFGVLFLVLLTHRSLGREVVLWVGRRALGLGLLIAGLAVSGSLIFSDVIGFEPCLLCWWQRIALYPLLPLFLVAYFKRDRGVFSYALSLAVIAMVISIYHSFLQRGGNSLIPCSVTESCSRVYVMAFDYISIPIMSLTVALFVILLVWANKIYEKENSNT